ncbi:MAG: hypothetical protein ACREEM_50510 [Blastocatellia bacterium]
MTKKNCARFVLLAASLLFGLRALHSVSAHEGHKHSGALAGQKRDGNV